MLPPRKATKWPRQRVSAGGVNGGVATAVWAPPQPTLTAATGIPVQDEYEVLVHEDTELSGRLVAAIEIVSPSNKDRPENRRTFVAKWRPSSNRECRSRSLIW